MAFDPELADRVRTALAGRAACGERPMDFTGRPMKSYVFVAPSAVGDDASLGGWLDRALAFVATLPPK